MRAFLLGLLAVGLPGGVNAGTEVIFGDSFEPAPDCVATPSAPGCPALFGAASGITVGPGERVRTCFYFRSANAANAGLERIRSTFSGPVWSLTLFATYSTSTGLPADRFSPGTLSAANCGAFEFEGTRARLVYRTPRAIDTLETPPNDGTGIPIAIPLAPNQPHFVQLDLLNATDTPAAGGATISGYILSAPTFTPTAAFHMVHALFQIPPNSPSFSSERTCQVPAATKFWWFTTRTYQLGIRAKAEKVGAASTTLVESTHWEVPEIAAFGPPFVGFAGGEGLRQVCTWSNPNPQVVTYGDDPSTDETCEVVSYFFPATEGKSCFSGSGPL